MIIHFIEGHKLIFGVEVSVFGVKAATVPSIQYATVPRYLVPCTLPYPASTTLLADPPEQEMTQQQMKALRVINTQ